MKISGTLQFPGDKSLSHRAAIFAAMAEGTSYIENFLEAEDTLNTLKAMGSLGAEVTKISSAHYKVISQGIKKFKSPAYPLDLGNSGTGSRLLLGLLSGCNGVTATIDGDASLRKRPMKRVTAPLENLGAKISYENEADRLPVKVLGTKLPDIQFTETLGSAQVKSAVLLAALASQSALSLHEKIPSRDHTENMLRSNGVGVLKTPSGEGYIVACNPPYYIPPTTYKIWGDISSAAFFVVAGLLADEGELLIRNVLLNPYRDKYIQVLREMGGDIEILPQKDQCGEKGGDLIVRPSRLRGISISPDLIPSVIDELPILTIAGLFASGKFSFRNAHELRVKESDRIKVMVENLRAIGAEVEEFDDGLAVNGNQQGKFSGKVDSHMDHRIAMSFEVASLRAVANGAQPIEISGKEWIQTSFPSFYEKLAIVTPEDEKGAGQSSDIMVVTLDGPAGSGKSTVATLLAQQTGFRQIDSGALYRAYTLTAIEKVGNDPEALHNYANGSDGLRNAEMLGFSIDFDENGRQILRAATRIFGDDLRTPEVTRNIRHIANAPAFRNLVNKLISETGKKYSLVADGRDMGTVVFPHAPLKFYITAGLEERAKRRYAEFAAKHPGITVEQVAEQIAARDYEDENREFGALKPANDAIFIDTTYRSLEEVLRIIFAYLRRINSPLSSKS